jgi:hypothetical protein
MTITLLSNIIQQHATILTSIDAMLMTPLYVLYCYPTATAKMIQMLIAAFPDAKSMRNVLDEIPLMMYLKCTKEEFNLYQISRQKLPLVKL